MAAAEPEFQKPSTETTEQIIDIVWNAEAIRKEQEFLFQDLFNAQLIALQALEATHNKRLKSELEKLEGFLDKARQSQVTIDTAVGNILYKSNQIWNKFEEPPEDDISQSSDDDSDNDIVL